MNKREISVIEGNNPTPEVNTDLLTMRFSKQRNVWLIAGREYRTSYVFPRINETVVSPPPCVPIVETCRQDFEGRLRAISDGENPLREGNQDLDRNFKRAESIDLERDETADCFMDISFHRH